MRRAPRPPPILSLTIALSLSACAAPRCPEALAPPPAAAATAPAPAAAPAPALPPLERIVDGGVVRLRFRADPLANLVHQLDCLAGLIPCSREAYDHLWKSSLGWGQDDAGALDRWRAQRVRWNASFETDDPGARPALPMPRPELRGIEQRLAIASFLARSPEEHATLLGLLTSPRDAANTEALLAGFRPRFARWWSERGERLARASVDGFAELFVARGLAGEIARVAAFYEAALSPGETLDFHVMARPAHDSLNMSRQVGPHAEIEVLEGDVAADRAAVVIHELYHYFYASAPRDKQLALSARLLRDGGPLSAVAHVAMNEVLATGLGSARVDRAVRPEHFAQSMAKPLGLYADQIVDPLTKAFLPALDARLAAGETLFSPGVADDLLAATRRAFPRGAPAVGYLRPLIIAHLPELGAAIGDFDQETRAGSFGGLGATELEEKPEDMGIFEPRARWPAAFLTTAAGVKRLARYAEVLPAAAIRDAEREARRGAPFLLVARAPSGTPRLVIVAPDAPTATKLLRDALTRDGLPDGIYPAAKDPPRSP